MRKLAVFALVFGIGLAVLLFFVRWRGDRRQRTVPVVPIDTGSESQRGEVLVPLPGKESTHQAGDEGFVEFDGRVEFTGFDPDHPEALPTFHIVARDVDHVQANEHELHDIVLEFFDERTGAIRASLKAGRGRAHMQPIATQPHFVQDKATRLWDVEFTLLSDAPFVPLTAYVPVVDVDIDARTFSSEDQVELRGRGMTAESLGLFVDEPAGIVRLVRDGSIDLWVDDETRIQLDATGEGPIELGRVLEEDGELLTVEARGGALLVIEGQEALSSTSETLLIRGRRAGLETAGKFLPLDANATGGVVLRRGSDRFEGRTGRIEFEPDGRPRTATLAGEPHAWAWVDAALDDREAGERVQIELSGAGPLVAGFRPQTVFKMGGPGRVRVEAMNLTVDASESISGEIERDGGRGTIWLRGDVDARGEEASFLGPALDLLFRRDERGDSVLEGRSPGPSHIEWSDPSGRTFVVDTEGEADWVVVGEELLVPLARKARVKLEGEGGFEASAGLLQDFVRSTRSFEGSEGVEYITDEGIARADRVVAHGPEEATFFGRDGLPATFELGASPEGDFDQGSLQAKRVVRGLDTVTAEEDVVLELDSADGRHHLECNWLQLSSPALVIDAPDDVAHPFVVRARGVKRADFAGDFGEGKVGAREIVLRGTFLPKPAPAPSPEAGEREGDGGPGGPGVQDQQGVGSDEEPIGRSGRAQLDAVEARGAVQIEFHGDSEISGEGDSFEWNTAGGGRLSGGRGRRATARGRIATGERAYRISAEWIEFGERFVNARWPRLQLDEAMPDPREPGEDLLIGASSEWMGADEDGILFSGLAHLVGRLSSGEDWRLDAGAVHVELSREESGEPGPAGALESIVAWDGFEVQVGRELLAQGDVLEADFRVLRMEGAPARMQFLGFVLESSHIEYDVANTLVKTEQGRATGQPGSGYEGWTLEYESLEPHEVLDSTILVVRNPSVRDDTGQEVRAAWALFWVDRDRWQARTQDLVGPLDSGPELRAERIDRAPEQIEQAPSEDEGVRTIFGKLRTGAVAQVLTETYLEGDVEFLRDGERYARMDAAYIDLIDGHGWLQNAEVYWDIEISDSPTRLVARAEWMRHSADGSLQADRATVTSCDFAEPHMFIQTKDLRFTPVDDQPGVFRVQIHSNSLRFDNGFAIPLPPLTYKSDSKGRPYFGNLSFGDSARFGNFVSGTFNAGLGVAGSAVADMVGSPSADVDGRVRYRASWLGSRGLLLGTGLEASVPDKFWMNLYADAINDDGEDLGLVRVPVDDRPSLRYYIRGRARYLLTEREWFDFALDTQSDAGVQSEFYEGQFLYYEERDNYIHWRKAENESFRSMMAAGRFNSFRNYLARLPNAIIYDGKTPIGDVSGLPLLYSNNTEAGLVRRLAGTEPQSPFDPDFDDGIGDRTILRGDTTQRFELPFALKQGSWRVSPFTSARGTFWSEAQEEQGSAARANLYAGVETSTHFERNVSSGLASAFTPTIGIRTDVLSASDEQGLLPIDELEAVPREGFFVDLGLRTELRLIGKGQRLTFDLRGTHGTDVDVGQDGWSPVSVLAQLDAHIGSMPVFWVHDGRYDPDDDLTVFSRSAIGFVPTPDIGVEFGLHTGRDDSLERVYDAGSVGASWRATEKWEFVVSNTVDFIGGGRLAGLLVLRRYGHDFVFDLQLTQRSAEGTSIGFTIRPLLGFRSRRLGQIERWLNYDG